MQAIRARDWALFSFLFLYSFIPIFGGLGRVGELIGGPAIIPANPRALDQPLPDVVHILASIAFCLIGALQVLPSLRRHSPRRHRHLGRIAALAGVISALTGLWMTQFYGFPVELQGTPLYAVRILLSLTMAGLIVRAVAAIRSGKRAIHRASMIRAYAIGLGASTQAIVGVLVLLLLGEELLGPDRDIMMIAAWGMNLLAAELILRRIDPHPSSGSLRKPSRPSSGDA